MILASLAILLIGAGLLFFIAGTLGLLRFPDVLCRVHALTKADNVGLGLVAAGLALLGGSWAVAFKLLLIWLLVMAAGTTAAQLVAGHSQQDEQAKGKRP